jgi:hypothetical protein
MLTAALKQLPWMLALFVLGPIAGHLAGGLRAADGSGDATLLLGNTPVAGVVAGLVTLAFAGLAGIFASRLNGCRSGMNAAGIVLAWAASQTATIDAILRRAQSPAPLMTLAIEGLIFGLLAAPVAGLIWHAGLGRGMHNAAHPLPDGAPGLLGFALGAPRRGKLLLGEHQSLAAAALRSILRPSGLAAIGATVVAGVVICHLVCQDTLKGQAIFGAALTGIVAVPLGRLAGESLKEQPPMVAFVLGFAVLGLVGPLAAQLVQGGSLIETLYSGKLLGVASPVSLDWLAGAFLGLPIGEAWFCSMFQAQAAKVAAQR